MRAEQAAQVLQVTLVVDVHDVLGHGVEEAGEAAVEGLAAGRLPARRGERRGGRGGQVLPLPGAAVERVPQLDDVAVS